MPRKKRIKDFYKIGTKNQRVYTLTTFQYLVGFVISVSFSMLLGPLLEAYGPRYLEGAAHGMEVIWELLFEEQGPPLVLEPVTPAALPPSVQQVPSPLKPDPLLPQKSAPGKSSEANKKGAFDELRDEVKSMKEDSTTE